MAAIRALPAALAAASALALAGCSGADAPTASLSPTGNGQIRMETYCSLEGLAPALRQTFIVVDERTLTPIAQAAEFGAKNAAVRDAVMTFSDPAGSIEGGRSAPRERITLLVAPADGAAPRQIFTGCLPGLSADERAAVAKGESKLDTFFTGGAASKLEESANDFRAAVAGAMVRAAQAIPAQPSAPGTESTLFGSLAATGQMFRSTDAVPRIVLVSDHLPLPADAGDEKAARATAFTEAGALRVDLGNAEVFAIGHGGNDGQSRTYLQAFLLRMNGHLVSWSADATGVTPLPAPTSLQRYSGTATYPGGSDEIVQIRLATDASGKLVDSWLVLAGQPFDRSIPLTGQGVCDAGSNCHYKSDNGGFAQAWVAARGAEVSFDNLAPFGGMRQWALDTSGNDLKGRIFDPAVSQVGNVPGVDSIPIKAVLQQKANF